MQKTLLASVIILSLSACDSDSTSPVIADGIVTSDETTVVDTTATGADATDVATTDDGTTATQISDDAGSATSDGGQTAADGDSGNVTIVDNAGDDSGTDADGGNTVTISDDAGSATSDGGQGSDDDADGGQISDDAGSATSDGGQISDDAGSSTSDGGQVSDDAGSATSDGGQVSDDAGSSTSDGGSTAAADTRTVDAPAVVNIQSVRDTDAGSFASDDAGGDVIRVSSLVSNTSAEVCTTASNQNNFSDTRIGDFILHNNAWRTFRAAPGYEWEQCVYTNTNGAIAGWNYDWGPGVGGSADFYVRSYPELIYGVKDEFRTSAPQSETGLPVVLTDLPNIRIDYSYDGPQFGESRIVDASNNPRFPNGSTISGERNVAVESFYYEPDAAGNCTTDIVTRNGGSNHTFEVMVWLDAGAERLPAGANDFVADLTIRGDAYKVYTKSSDPRYIAFVAQNPQTTGTIFWNDFADWARDNSFQVSELFGARSNTVQIQDDWCVANILVGTEIFWGAGNLDIFEWTITQSR